MTVRLAVGHQGNRLDAQGRREPGQRPAAAGYPDPSFFSELKMIMEG
jgi:hypothetical protein